MSTGIPTRANRAIGLLYPGELGAALARVLTAQGCRVLTTLNGRSSRTAEFALQAGVATIATLDELVRECDVILSVVTPGAAVDVASDVAEAVSRTIHNRSERLLYIDANSVSPQTIADIEDTFAGLPVEVMDAAVHGVASRLEQQGTIFISGNAADAVEKLFGQNVRVKIVGDRPGRASLHKMLLGSMSKGMIAVFLQSALAAEKMGLTQDLCDEIRHFYPGLMEFLARSLPTYPQHAFRRSEEMRELQDTMTDLELQSNLIDGIRQIFLSLASTNLADRHAAAGCPVDVPRLVELIADEDPLRWGTEINSLEALAT